MEASLSCLARSTLSLLPPRKVVGDALTTSCDGHKSVALTTQLLARKQFLGNGFSAASCAGGKLTSLKQQTRGSRTVVARAAVATETAALVMKETHYLEDGSKLQVVASGSTDESRASVLLEVSDGPLADSAQLLAHWGATKASSSGWTLPGLQPDGTRNYKHRALQSPFKKEGGKLVLKIDIVDREYNGIEFTLKDEATNKWFKLKDGNFRVSIPESRAHQDPAMIVIPEELVRVQAYLRWERNGKQNYSQEKEKEEYEKSREELQREVASGVSIQTLEQRLLGGGSSQAKEEQQTTAAAAPPAVSNGNGTSTKTAPAAAPAKSEPEVYVPEDLLAVQAYIRWERNGKQNYSPEKQQEEYVAAKKELQDEVRRGTSIDSLRKKLTGGSKATAPPPPAAAPSSSRPREERIKRNQWSADEMINRWEGGKLQLPEAQDGAGMASLGADPLELAAQIVVGAENGVMKFKKPFKLRKWKLLVLVTELDGAMQVRMASDHPQPLVLHWGLSKGRNETWQSPPDAVCSTEFERACETPFERGFAGDESLQSLCLELGGLERDYPGLPFVVRNESGDEWFKDGSRDFFVGLKPEELVPPADVGDGRGTARGILDSIANEEPEAEKSLMHRFRIGSGILQSARTFGSLGLAAIFVWFRFMATRQLVWNNNYNVKPREISAAQDEFTNELEDIFRSQPELRELTRMVMMTVGRGGEGDVGQRIRDEILIIQRNNDCKGGMMEEWHQKLHNNTSPDDVVICEALLDYIRSDFNIDEYWRTLNANGVTRERLLSYDKAIHNEPKFVASQKQGLLRDLSNYLKSLKAVHSGADLESAISTAMGYKQGAHADFMKSIEIHPIRGLSPALPRLLQFVLEHVEDRQVINLMEGLLEARRELRPSLLSRNQERLKDCVFLDLALDSTVRTAAERGMEHAKSAGEIIYMVTMMVENICLSVDDNEELVYALKDWQKSLDSCYRGEAQWALKAKAVSDRTRLFLTDKAEKVYHLVQPTAEYLGGKLGVGRWAVDIFAEEVVRSGTAATLSILLGKLDPILRRAADMGSWQVISPDEVAGFVHVIDDMGSVQETVFERPTVLIAGRVKGEEEIPDGVVALLTPDMPDVLSHVSVRARNSKVCFATCFDEGIFADLKQREGQVLKVIPCSHGASSDIQYIEIAADDFLSSQASSSAAADDGLLIPEGMKIKQKSFAGRFAISSDDFNPELVGAKSRNIAGLRGKLPDWVRLPTSVAIPFGSFEAVLADPMNKQVQAEIGALQKDLDRGDFGKLAPIRRAILNLQAPSRLVHELQSVMTSAGMPWPGDEGEERWQKAWTAIKKVWASKWNERAFVSMRKVKLNFNDLCMAVLVQEVVRADYAFVIHTTNPSSGDESEIYAEIVKGLGETLVGAFTGRALSFSCPKPNAGDVKVLGYPSKRVGLFICQSIIFRSDSNGEDLEGYAGAGLYDSVPMDAEEEKFVDYSVDRLIVDSGFQRDILSKIAAAGMAIENALGSAQDIEGVIKDGEIYIVQTRPQM